MRLEIGSRFVGEVLVVTCRGRIVAGDEAARFHDHLNRAMQETPLVIVDLAEVVFVDSSGIGTLVRQMTHARSRGGDLKLCGVPEFVTKTLRMTALDTVFEIHASQPEAVAAYYGSRRSRREESPSSQTILCVHESGDVLAFLRELLRRAGYGVLTTRMMTDAKILAKAARPQLVMLGQRTERGENAEQLLGKVAPTIPVVLLEDDFSIADPGVAGVALLDKVQRALSASQPSTSARP
jgi:anti-sigma B factor antagonist